MQRVEEESGTVMGPGTVYGSLQRLEEAGLIREVEEDGDGDRRRRFALTDRGREALEREAVRLERMTGLLQRRGIGAS
jgi:DNA-binding PadR family transcriptional regulator